MKAHVLLDPDDSSVIRIYTTSQDVNLGQVVDATYEEASDACVSDIHEEMDRLLLEHGITPLGYTTSVA